jgi:aryl-alcohol dehydrogenase-like predicted oxidoreductase
MTDVVRAGKARYIGFSGWAPEQIRTAMALPGVEGFISSQPQYSLLHRGPEAEVIPLSAANASRKSSGRLWRRACCQGSTSRVRSYRRRAARQSNHGPDDAILPTAAILAGVQHLKPLAEEAGCTMTQFALRQPNVASAIRGGESAGSTRRQRRRLRPSYRPGPLRQGRGDRRSDPHGALELDRRRRRLVFAERVRRHCASRAPRDR